MKEENQRLCIELRTLSLEQAGGRQEARLYAGSEAAFGHNEESLLIEGTCEVDLLSCSISKSRCRN